MNFAALPWKEIGKYGLATVFASVLLGFFLHAWHEQNSQLENLHESTKDHAVASTKIADAIDDFGTAVAGFAKETDDVGDELREIKGVMETLSDRNGRVLERVWREVRAHHAEGQADESDNQ